jgi:NADP-dependent 3-hydroxy acid dehydrogenase YdfG
MARGEGNGVSMSGQSLEGTVALVTGASSGIGAATARHLAREGAAVALVARRRGRIEQVAEDIRSRGGRAVPLEADITEPDRAESLVQDTLDRLGRLDILVNNAGIMLLNSALHTTLEDWDRMISLNLSALLHVTHAAIPYLIDAAVTSPRQVSDLVNVSSTAGRVARAGNSVYNLTKFGLNGFTESLRQELLAEHVRVSVVEPGTVDTELVNHLDDAARDAARRQICGIEALRADDVAEAIGYIVTRERRVAVNEMLVRAGDQTW